MVAHWRQTDRKYANCTVPLLVGPQAYRKSTFCRSLLPPELQAYYTDRIDFSNKRDAELSLNRFALINMDEFDQNRVSQQAFLKHILQNRLSTSGVRMAPLLKRCADTHLSLGQAITRTY